MFYIDLDMIITDEYIIKLFKCSTGINHHWRKKLNDEIIEYLNNRFEEKSRSIREDICRILYGYENIDKCKICGKPAVFIGKPSHMYKETCCNECSQKLNIIHGKETCLKKYGNKNYRNIEKSKQTCLEKYGCSYTFQNRDVINKIEQTKLQRYGSSTYNNSYKNKQTCLERYGYENVFQVEQYKEKIKQTKIKLHNDPYFTNREKFKETCTYLYGGCGAASSYIHNKMKETNLSYYGYEYTLQVPENIEKRKQTCLNKYGFTTYTQTQEYRDFLKMPEIQKQKQEKEYLTKKKNNSFNKSDIEDKIYNDLISIFNNNVIRHYKSDEYSYSCDFYIKSLNLYIEYNGFWTHNDHVFDENNDEDIKILHSWLEKAKTSNFYKNAIYTWTQLDVKKYNLAKQNKLNYLIFYNYNEFINWLNIYRNDTL